MVAAKEAVNATVAEMAAAVGMELTAQMLGVEAAEVRRVVKAAQASPAGKGANGSKASV